MTLPSLSHADPVRRCWRRLLKLDYPIWTSGSRILQFSCPVSVCRYLVERPLAWVACQHSLKVERGRAGSRDCDRPASARGCVPQAGVYGVRPSIVVAVSDSLRIAAPGENQCAGCRNVDSERIGSKRPGERLRQYLRSLLGAKASGEQ